MIQFFYQIISQKTTFLMILILYKRFKIINTIKKSHKDFGRIQNKFIIYVFIFSIIIL